MSEHTPTPWRTRRDGEQRIETDTGQYVGHAVDQTIAAHIVHCVNVHDELVGALEWIAKEALMSNLSAQQIGGRMEAMRQLAIAALAKAKGSS